MCSSTISWILCNCKTAHKNLQIQEDGNEYCTATIGNLIWMTENLRYSESGSKGHWYNDEDNADNLSGRLWPHLKKFPEAQLPWNMDLQGSVQGICPDGWRLPTNKDFSSLVQAAGGINNLKLSTTLHFGITLPHPQLPVAFNAGTRR